ncbi:hypothetical protein ACQJBY_057240 [Aegilops geniculata]
MQGEVSAVSRGREDAHHEGVSGMMEVISARSPLPSTGGGHRLLFHGVVGAFPCQAQRLLGWITVAHLTGVVGKICISILATLHPLAGMHSDVAALRKGSIWHMASWVVRQEVFWAYSKGL